MSALEIDHAYYPPRTLRPEELVVVGNSIDKVLTTYDMPTLYEGSAFYHLAERNFGSTQSILLGPGLLNHMFANEATHGLGRPDAIWMHPTPEGQWMITDLAEFKSGTGIGMTSKLRGFETFLDTLREEPTLLPWLLSHTLGQGWDNPELVVPPIKEVTVLFVAPYIHGVQEAPNTEFGVIFTRLPNEGYRGYVRRAWASNSMQRARSDVFNT